MSDCFVCDKHEHTDRIPGGAILIDDYTIVAHAPLTTPHGTTETAYLGHLLVETRRHARELGDLSEVEAASFGRLSARAAKALQVTGVEHVYTAIIGHGVDHLHMHLLPRYPNTPKKYWWTAVDEWPEAPRGDAAAIAALASRLRRIAS